MMTVAFLIIDIMQRELKWSDVEKDDEVRRVNEFLKSFGGPRPMK